MLIYLLMAIVLCAAGGLVSGGKAMMPFSSAACGACAVAADAGCAIHPRSDLAGARSAITDHV